MQTSLIHVGTDSVSPAPPLPHVRTALDEAWNAIQDGRIAAGLDDLFDDLSARREDEPSAWPAYAKACLNHPLRGVLHQDPFTWRAFDKPRGYAGDAVMMDYIYGLGEAREAAQNATPLGRTIFRHMATRPSARAVCYRRALLADLIDRTAARGGRSVFALAAGHLREAEVSSAVRQGRIERFVAMDQDDSSLDLIARDYGHLGIRASRGSVRRILGRKAKSEPFDLVYAAGLYDYLQAPVATALTRHLFDMTAPGGTLLVPNFLQGARDTAYMEAFMDWHLIYRDHADMEALVRSLPAAAVAGYEIFDDPDDTITFLLVSKSR